jgi:hypothetical protein
VSQNNFPCVCGHMESVHITAPDYMGGDSWCFGDNVEEPFQKQFDCSCYKYIPDNLKYLESKLDEKANG